MAVREGRSSDHGGGGALIALGAAAIAGAAVTALWLGTRETMPHPHDDAPGRAARRRRFGDYAVTGRTVTIARPREEVYAFWRDFQNLPQFMENVVAVNSAGQDTARWTIAGPAGRHVRIETEIVADRKGEEIAWRSTGGSEIDTEGKIEFRDAPAGRGTEVTAIVAYVPPMGELGRWVASAFQKEPSIQGRRELKRLKMLLETGEIATSRNRRNA